MSERNKIFDFRTRFEDRWIHPLHGLAIGWDRDWLQPEPKPIVIRRGLSGSSLTIRIDFWLFFYFQLFWTRTWYVIYARHSSHYFYFSYVFILKYLFIRSDPEFCVAWPIFPPPLQLYYQGYIPSQMRNHLTIN